MTCAIRNGSVKIECDGQYIPLPGALGLLLPSAPVAPPEGPTWVDGAMVLGSWDVVMSDNDIITSKCRQE